MNNLKFCQPKDVSQTQFWENRNPCLGHINIILGQGTTKTKQLIMVALIPIPPFPSGKGDLETSLLRLLSAASCLLQTSFERRGATGGGREEAPGRVRSWLFQSSTCRFGGFKAVKFRTLVESPPCSWCLFNNVGEVEHEDMKICDARRRFWQNTWKPYIYIPCDSILFYQFHWLILTLLAWSYPLVRV